MTRQELLGSIEQNRSGWEKLLSASSPEDLQRSGVVGRLSVKDALAQFATLDRWMIVQLRSAFDGTTPTRRELSGGVDYPPEFYTHLREDRRNRLIYTANRDRPLETILTEWRDVVASMADLVSARTEDELGEMVGLDPKVLTRRPSRSRGWADLDRPMHRDLRRAAEVPQVFWSQPVRDWVTGRVRQEAGHLIDTR